MNDPRFDDWFSQWLLRGHNAYWTCAALLLFAAGLWLLR